MSFEEIAERLGTTVPAVVAVYRNAIRKLRAQSRSEEMIELRRLAGLRDSVLGLGLGRRRL